MSLFNQDFKIGSILTSVTSLFDMRRGIAAQEQAADIAGRGYRSSAQRALEVAEVNIGLDKRELDLTLSQLSRQLQSNTAIQRSQTAASGIDIGSQSTQSVINAGIDGTVRAIITARDNQKIMADQRRYGAQVQAAELENRARAAEFQAEVQASNSKRRMGQFIPSILNQIGSLF